MCSFSEMLNSYHKGVTQSRRSPRIHLIAWEDLVGVHKIAVSETVQCHDGAQGLWYKKYIIYWKKIEVDSWQSKAVSENKTVQKKCGL